MPYLRETIDSIVAQTFTDWEAIIVDNVSADGSPEYVEERAAVDPRIRVLRNDADLGVTTSLNRGLESCRAAWVARIDGDDRAMPQRLERQVAFVRANPDVMALSCFAYYINVDGKRIGIADHDLTSREAYRSYMAQNELIGILHPGALINRDGALKAGGYRAEYELAEDIDLWNRLSERGPVLVLPEYLMEYRLHPGSYLTNHLRQSFLRKEWVRAGMLARRSGGREPTWDEFQADRRSAAPWTKLSHERLLLADWLFRSGRQHLAAGQRLTAGLQLALGMTLRPSHALPRLRRRLGSLRSTHSGALPQNTRGLA